MAPPFKLQDVFKVAGVPDITFVEPSGFAALRVAIDTPGRGVVIEGPSGIGKSTAVSRALTELGIDQDVLRLSARDPADVEFISALPEIADFGVVVVDDFHRLPDDDKRRLADLMKLLADREAMNSRLIVIGINEAGRALIEFAGDLANRVEILRFEVEPPQAVTQLIRKGETALNVAFEAREKIADAANGSFYIAQMLCFEMCLADRVFATVDSPREITASLAGVVQRVMERQETRFGKAVRTFVRGPRFRPTGRAAYLHVFRWLAESDSWSISLPDEIARHPSERISVGQIVDKGYLATLIDGQGISDILHFDQATRVLSVEDPHLVFYMRNLDWPRFIRDSGFTTIDFNEVYDVALSFAGEDREYASNLNNHLSDLGYAVFYDLAEQHRILSQNIGDFLGPIYESGARFVVAVLGEMYGIKRWTLFESDRFKSRIEAGEVVPIWSKSIPPSAFDEVRKIGSLSYDPDGDLDMQARHAADIIGAMIDERDAGKLPLASGAYAETSASAVPAVPSDPER